MRSTRFVVAALLISAWIAHAQSIIYTISYRDTAASLRARGTTILGATNEQKVAMTRSLRKTEIYSGSLADGKKTLQFSDEGLGLELTPFAEPGHPLGLGKAYIAGVEREWRTGPSPGVFASTPAYYEISLDGSRRFRKLFERQENSKQLMVNWAGTRAAYRGYVGDKYIMAVFELTSAKLLHSWELTPLLKAHCPDCLPMHQGWLADGDRFFVRVDLGDEDSISPHAKNEPGIYLTSGDGKNLGPLPSPNGRHEVPGYKSVNSMLPFLAGQSRDGRFFFQDFAVKVGPQKPPIHYDSILLVTDSKLQALKQFPLQHSPGVSGIQISASGRYIAFIEDRIVNYRTERHLWSKDLESGEEREWLVIPPPAVGSPEPEASLTLLGIQE
jgi:hypothetical protein